MSNNQVQGGWRMAGPMGLDVAGFSAVQTPKREQHKPLKPLKQQLNLQPNLKHNKSEVEPVYTFGNLPEKDGDINIYSVSRHAIFFVESTHKGKGTYAPKVDRSRGPRKSKYPVIFVNGQMGNRAKHKMQACAVAAVSGGKVWGVYNQSSDNLVLDTLQSMQDKLTSSFLLDIAASVMKLVGGTYAAQEALSKELSKYNAATAALFNLLCTPGFETAKIVAHSQGNIIVSNTLNALIALKGKEAVQKMKVFAIASPVTFWTDAKSIVKVYSFSNDAVGWLSLDCGTLPKHLNGWKAQEEKDSEIVKKLSAGGSYFTHSFYLYLNNLWDMLWPEFD